MSSSYVISMAQFDISSHTTHSENRSFFPSCVVELYVWITFISTEDPRTMMGMR